MVRVYETVFEEPHIDRPIRSEKMGNFCFACGNSCYYDRYFPSLSRECIRIGGAKLWRDGADRPYFVPGL
jgi:hypothetical protein